MRSYYVSKSSLMVNPCNVPADTQEKAATIYAAMMFGTADPTKHKKKEVTLYVQNMKRGKMITGSPPETVHCVAKTSMVYKAKAIDGYAGKRDTRRACAKRPHPYRRSILC